MTPPDSSSNLPNDQVAVRDEILQIMFWLRGEKLAEDVAASELSQWIGFEAARIEPLLFQLAKSKLVEQIPGTGQNFEVTARFRLTSSGVHEGGRRFADEFADLTKPGHYECGDPNCECQRTGDPADCVHQH